MDNLGLLSDPKNIIELFTFDLTTFFLDDDYEEIDCHEEKGVFMIEYKKNLPWLEFGLFDHVIFRVFNDKENIIGSNHINVKLPANTDLLNEQALSQFTNTLFNIHGWDDDSMGNWSNKDAIAFKKGEFHRNWTLGENKFIYSLKMTQHNNNLSLQILFFNHLLKLTKQTISQHSNEFGS